MILGLFYHSAGLKIHSEGIVEVDVEQYKAWMFLDVPLVGYPVCSVAMMIYGSTRETEQAARYDTTPEAVDTLMACYEFGNS